MPVPILLDQHQFALVRHADDRGPRSRFDDMELIDDDAPSGAHPFLSYPKPFPVENELGAEHLPGFGHLTMVMSLMSKHVGSCASQRMVLYQN